MSSEYSAYPYRWCCHGILCWRYSSTLLVPVSLQNLLCIRILTDAFRPVAGGQTLLPASFSPEPGYAAAVVWAEREIGLSYSYSVSNDSQGVYSGFVVPTPPMLNSTVSARWLTDVIGFNPYCAWANPANLTVTSLNFTMNSTQVPSTAVSVHLEDLDLQVSVPSSYFRACTLVFRVYEVHGIHNNIRMKQRYMIRSSQPASMYMTPRSPFSTIRLVTCRQMVLWSYQSSSVPPQSAQQRPSTSSLFSLTSPMFRQWASAPLAQTMNSVSWFVNQISPLKHERFAQEGQ